MDRASARDSRTIFSINMRGLMISHCSSFRSDGYRLRMTVYRPPITAFTDTAVRVATSNHSEASQEFKFEIFDRSLAAISSFGLIASGVFALINYNNQGKVEARVRERELQVSIYREKKAIYYPLCDTAAGIVSCDSQKESRKTDQELLDSLLGEGASHRDRHRSQLREARLPSRSDGMGTTEGPATSFARTGSSCARSDGSLPEVSGFKDGTQVIG